MTMTTILRDQEMIGAAMPAAIPARYGRYSMPRILTACDTTRCRATSIGRLPDGAIPPIAGTMCFMTPRLRLLRLLACVTALSLGLAACAGGSSAPGEAATASQAAAISPVAPTISPPAPSRSPCPSSGPAPTVLRQLARFGPTSGVWVGMNLDWGSETVAGATSQLGRPPATVVTFVSFPLTADDTTNLDASCSMTFGIRRRRPPLWP